MKLARRSTTSALNALRLAVTFVAMGLAGPSEVAEHAIPSPIMNLIAVRHKHRNATGAHLVAVLLEVPASILAHSSTDKWDYATTCLQGFVIIAETVSAVLPKWAARLQNPPAEMASLWAVTCLVLFHRRKRYNASERRHMACWMCLRDQTSHLFSLDGTTFVQSRRVENCPAGEMTPSGSPMFLKMLRQ